MIKKMINNIYYVILILIPVGWFLNWKYYFSRFESEGFGWIGLVLSIALVIFASFVFTCSQYFKQKKSEIWKIFFIAYFILALYSINCTAAGQYWDQQKINEKISTEIIDKENTAFLISLYQEKIKELKTEYDKLNDMRNKSLKDLGDLYYYKNTTKTVEDMKNKIKKELKSYELKLENLLKENKVSAKNMNNIEMSKTLYIFYAVIFNMEKGSEEIIQFIFQVILSFIIESIAQMALFAFMKIKYFSEKEEETEIEKSYSPIEITKNELRHFAVIAWRGIDKKQCQTLLNKTTFMKIIKNICHTFTDEKYRFIMRIAITKRLIKKDKNGYLPGSEFVDREFFYRKMCEIMKFT